MSGQKLAGRRAPVFAVRILERDRAKLEAIKASVGGPRGLGPWLVWRALGDVGALPGPGTTGAGEAVAVMPARAGSADKRRGTTDPGPALPSRRGTTRAIAERTILDLCAGSGSWSLPYERAGYRVVRVSLPANDVRTFVPPSDVWGVLAAPPCEQFSLARRAPRDFVRGMETVNACLRVVATCQPRWWALENPVGMLRRFLGTPVDVFEPCDFGDPWTKRTALWGDFAIPARGPFVRPLGGGPLCFECDPDRKRSTWCNSAAHRARTPAGFARAFFEANP